MNLSPRAVVIVALAALLGIAGQWSDRLGGLPWWRVIVAILVLGLAYELLATRRGTVSCRLVGRNRLYLGRADELRLEFENRTRRASNVRFAPALPSAVLGHEAPTSIRIEPWSKQIARLDVRPVVLGVHEWPPVPARISGPFGLAWWPRRLSGTLELRVLPDTLGPRAARVGSTEIGATAQAALGGARELHHLREYRAGDPRHMIDWKATARASRLITRVFSEDQHLEVVVVLDAGRTSRTETDGISQLGHYVNLAARFAEYCVSSDDQVGLVAFADEPIRAVPPGRGMEAVTRVRGALAGLVPLAVESDVLKAALRVRRLVRRRCLVVMLTDLYERSATSQLAQSVRLLAPKHLPMVVGLVSDEIVGLADGPARDWLDPYRGLAAREYRRHVAANVARLTQLGAHALTARPRELDQKVLSRYASLRARHRI